MGRSTFDAVSWLLMLVTVGLALPFRKSDNLAGAYAIAVSATMILTRVLLPYVRSCIGTGSCASQSPVFT